MKKSIFVFLSALLLSSIALASDIALPQGLVWRPRPGCVSDPDMIVAAPMMFRRGRSLGPVVNRITAKIQRMGGLSYVVGNLQGNTSQSQGTNWQGNLKRFGITVARVNLRLQQFPNRWVVTLTSSALEGGPRSHAFQVCDMPGANDLKLLLWDSPFGPGSYADLEGRTEITVTHVSPGIMDVVLSPRVSIRNVRKIN